MTKFTKLLQPYMISSIIRHSKVIGLLISKQSFTTFHDLKFYSVLGLNKILEDNKVIVSAQQSWKNLHKFKTDNY